MDERQAHAHLEPVGDAVPQRRGRGEHVLPALVDVEHADEHRFNDLDSTEQRAIAIGAGIIELQLPGQLAAPRDDAALVAR